MNRVRLVITTVSEIVGGDSMGLIILTNEAGDRALSIICDKQMKLQICLRKLNPPAKHSILLPEVLSSVVADMVDWADFEIYIYNLVDGEYRTVLRNVETMHEYAVRASDAVLLSVIANVPVYIDAALFFTQSAPYNGHTDSTAVPINAISTERLEQVLSKAIEEEDYRLASHIKEELEKRRAQ